MTLAKKIHRKHSKAFVTLALLSAVSIGSTAEPQDNALSPLNKGVDSELKIFSRCAGLYKWITLSNQEGRFSLFNDLSKDEMESLTFKFAFGMATRHPRLSEYMLNEGLDGLGRILAEHVAPIVNTYDDYFSRHQAETGQAFDTSLVFLIDYHTCEATMNKYGRR